MENVLPEVSVIIPTRNRPKSVLRAVSSAVNSADKAGVSIEVIVVNDGSEESYGSLLSRFRERISYIESDTQQGVSHSRNLGISAARSDWLAFLDDDDYFLDSYVGFLVSSIRREPEHRIFFTGARVLSGDVGRGVTERSFDASLTRRKIIKDFLSIGMGFGVAIHREVFDGVGLFDTSFRVAEDTELFFRALTANYLPSIIPGVNIVKDEVHKNRLSTSFKLYSDLNVYDRIFERHESQLIESMKYNYIHMLMWAYRVHRTYCNVLSESRCLLKLRSLGIPESHVNACYKSGDDISDEYTLV